MFENKIRDLIQHVIAPLDGKNDKLFKKYTSMHKEFEVAMKRLNEIEFGMERVRKQTHEFEELAKGQDRYRHEIKEMNLQMKVEIQNSSNKVLKFEKRIVEFEHHIDLIRKDVDALRLSYQQTIDNSQGLVESAQAMQAEVKTDCSLLIDQAKEKISSIDQLRRQFKRTTEGLLGDVKLINHTLDKQNKHNQSRFVVIEKDLKDTQQLHEFRIDQANFDLRGQAMQLNHF